MPWINAPSKSKSHIIILTKLKVVLENLSHPKAFPSLQTDSVAAVSWSERRLRMGDDRNQCRSRAESDGKEKGVSPFVAPFLNNQLKYSQISDRERFGKTELWATPEFVGKTKSGPVRLCNCQSPT